MNTKWRVLVSAPYILPAGEEFRARLEAEGVELVLVDVRERLCEEELLALAGTFDGAIRRNQTSTTVKAAGLSRRSVARRVSTNVVMFAPMM